MKISAIKSNIIDYMEGLKNLWTFTLLRGPLSNADQFLS